MRVLRVKTDNMKKDETNGGKWEKGRRGWGGGWGGNEENLSINNVDCVCHIHYSRVGSL